MGWSSLEKQREYMARYQAEHKAELAAKARARYLRNRDRILEQRRTYREANSAAIAERAESYLPRRRALRHGLDETIVDALYESQGGVCAICLAPFPKGGRNGLVIDHDHATGARRGLICRPCNIALPVIERHGIAWARQATEYLERPPLAVTWADQHVTDNDYICDVGDVTRQDPERG